MRKILVAVLFLLPTSVALAQISNDSIVAKFMFNGNTNDTSGKNRHGAIHGQGLSYTTDRFGNPNSAFLFTGANGSVRASIGKHTEEVSVSLWYYSDVQTTPYPHFFDYGDYKLRCHVMYGDIYNDDDQFAILYESYNASGNMLRGRIKPANSTWVHVVVTFNKNTGKEKLFVNGVFDREMNIGSGALSLADDILCIGRVRSGATSQTSMTYFNGKIDDVTVYARELTPSEISRLFNPNNDATSVQETTQKQNIVIYPNPVKDNLFFDVSGAADTEIKFSICDVNGKQLLAGNTNSPVDISQLSKGVYIITFIAENNISINSQRFIKE